MIRQEIIDAMTTKERAFLHNLIIDARMATVPVKYSDRAIAPTYNRYQQYMQAETDLCRNPTYRKEIGLP